MQLKYIKTREIYEIASIEQINDNVVQIKGNLPIQEYGFMLSSDGKTWDGDYSDYRTIYRIIEGGAQFSSDGNVYTGGDEPEPHTPNLEEVQEAKVAEMNAIQQEAITAGVDVTLNDGSVEHFTLTDHDQISLMGLQSQVLAGTEQIPWHTSNEDEHCKLYDNADMALITAAAMSYVTWHVTYFRDLRIYIRSLDSREAVEAVTYGMEIPEEYRSEPLQAMMAAKAS